ncbi:MAG: 30S ribosomal protein S17 [Bdellovibrionales bacterium]|nr:30S ribosomal protein S17 [Bdellovibrionales bacterium]
MDITEVSKPKEKKRGLPKTREGVVVSDKMNKTIVVAIKQLVRHRDYKKYVRVTTKYKAHDEREEAKIGDTVRIVETRPMSKDKRWRMQKVLVKAV